MYGLRRRIPVERDTTGRFWVIDDANLPAIAKTLGLTKKLATKPAAKPAKPKPSKPAPNRPARSASAA